MGKVTAILLIVLMLFTGCTGLPPIRDDLTTYDLPVVDSLDGHQIVYKMRNDGMYRSEQYAVGSSLVIDPEYYETKPIARGDVVYVQTAVTEHEIQIRQSIEFDIVRVVGLPGETVTVKQGQVYINGRQLNTFYGKQIDMKTADRPAGWTDGGREAFTLSKKVIIPDAHYMVAGDVWLGSGFHDEPVSKDKINGKVVGRMKKPWYDEMEMRTIAWNSITEAERKTVSHPMEQASTELFGSGYERYAHWIKSSFKTGKEQLIAVTFKTNDDGRIGPIVIFIDPHTKEMVGRNLRF